MCSGDFIEMCPANRQAGRVSPRVYRKNDDQRRGGRGGDERVCEIIQYVVYVQEITSDR